MNYDLKKRVSDSKIFDTHAHYYDKKFSGNSNSLFKELESECAVGKIINCGDNLSSSKECVKLAEKYDFLLAAVGVHPENLKEEKPDFLLLDKLCESRKTVAIGEIGLDYYWDKSYNELQKECFISQIDFAKQKHLPVIIHSRDAAFDTLNIIKKEKPLGVWHCFSESPEIAEELLKTDIYFGFGGVITFKNARKSLESVEKIPLERILLETDAPYMSPEPFRGRINNSSLIFFVAEKIAEIKGISTEEVIDTTYKNAARLFLND